MMTASREYPQRPIVGVGAVIVQAGQVVLVKRKYEPLKGQWSLPGGAVETGETLTEGIAREVLEETGLEIEVGPLITVFDRIVPDDAGRIRYHYVLADYLCSVTGGTAVAGSDVDDVALADPERLDDYKLNAKALEIIGQAMMMLRDEGPGTRNEGEGLGTR